MNTQEHFKSKYLTPNKEFPLAEIKDPNIYHSKIITPNTPPRVDPGTVLKNKLTKRISERMVLKTT